MSCASRILDRLIGKPLQQVESLTAKVDVAAMYLAALQRSNASHVLPSEP
jgi:hypothetical protein